MPSPFPGMDPYLEDPGLWPDVHHELISVARELLNRDLSPKYHVRVEERRYISDENDPGRRAIIPDLRIRQSPLDTRQPATSQEAADVAVAEPIVATTLIEDEIHEARLDVIDGATRSVVTVIEILSPTNKIAGSRGQQSYSEKRMEVMRSPSHFVEIDLLREGVAIWARERLPRGDYFVHVSRQDQRPKGLIWPIILSQRLPTIAVPLLPGDPDAKLDLQSALEMAYDRAAYDLEIDYRRDPVPTLASGDLGWADQLLREKSLRP